MVVGFRRSILRLGEGGQGKVGCWGGGLGSDGGMGHGGERV